MTTHADHEPPPGAWQERAHAFVAASIRRPWAPAGAKALTYLREQRGLSEATIRAAGLGYHDGQPEYEPPDAWGLDGGRKVWLPRGLTLPCQVDGALWYVKIRRPTGEPRYPQVRGGQVALYGADRLASRPVLVLSEGELDCLLLWQLAGDLIDVSTLGSASTPPTGRWLWRLARYQRVLVVYDADPAGERGAARVAALSRRVVAVQPPCDGDVTDAWRAGVNLRHWVQDLIAEHAPPTNMPPMRCWTNADLQARRARAAHILAAVHDQVGRLPASERPAPAALAAAQDQLVAAIRSADERRFGLALRAAGALLTPRAWAHEPWERGAG